MLVGFAAGVLAGLCLIRDHALRLADFGSVRPEPTNGSGGSMAQSEYPKKLLITNEARPEKAS